jgi:predicted GH43/DUF377 family glycosyl hydrolase
MWYSGYDGVNGRVGYATSNDGVGWTKYVGNPVLDIGPAGAFDDVSVTEVCVIRDGTSYKMWYTGNDGGPIGLATSPDGVNWTKHAANPVFGFGAQGTWDAFEVDDPYVLKEGGVYRMWYGGEDGLSGSSSIGYATSADGVAWTRHEANPVLGPGPAGTWDEWSLDVPSVVGTAPAYRMWYDGASLADIPGVGYATTSAQVPLLSHRGTAILALLLVATVTALRRRSTRRRSGHGARPTGGRCA